jgi:hypothetical protein
LGDHEGVAGEHDADVVMPADEGAPLVVVQAQLALEVFVRALDAPATLDGPHQLLARDVRWQRGEHELGRRRFALGPFDQQPLRRTRVTTAFRPGHSRDVDRYVREYERIKKSALI